MLVYTVMWFPDIQELLDHQICQVQELHVVCSKTNLPFTTDKNPPRIV